jgi:hypothetical protein
MPNKTSAPAPSRAKPTHTPAPLNVVRDPAILNGNPIICRTPKGAILCPLYGKNREADAAYIVKAYNAHEKLVAAASEALSVLEALAAYLNENPQVYIAAPRQAMQTLQYVLDGLDNAPAASPPREALKCTGGNRFATSLHDATSYIEGQPPEELHCLYLAFEPGDLDFNQTVFPPYAKPELRIWRDGRLTLNAGDIEYPVEIID